MLLINAVIFIGIIHSSFANVLNWSQKFPKCFDNVSLGNAFGINASYLPKWTRELFFKGNPAWLSFEVTPRASHRIISHIMAIISREVLLYRDAIRFVKRNWDDETLAVDRLTACPNNDCNSLPKSLINMEVWMPPGFTVDQKVKSGKVIDCGPLGPIARRGVFLDKKIVKKLEGTSRSLDLEHWRVFQQDSLSGIKSYMERGKTLRNSKNWVELPVAHGGSDKTYYMLATNETFLNKFLVLSNNIYNLSSSTSLRNKFPSLSVFMTPSNFVFHSTILSSKSDNLTFFVSWHPSPLTVSGSYSRVNYPDCDRTECQQFEANQLTKVVWSGLKDMAPYVFDLVNKFWIKPDQYQDILRKVDPLVLDETKQELNYFNIACDWLKSNTNSWTPIVKNVHNKKKKLYIALLYSTVLEEGPYPSADLLSSIAKELITENKKFQHTEYELELIKTSCSCKTALLEYLNLIELKYNDGHLIGVITMICDESLHSVVIANEKRQLFLISSTDFVLPKYTKAQYFFKIIKSLEPYKDLVRRVFQIFNWKKAAILRKDDNFVTKNNFEGTGINITYDHESKDDDLDYKKSQTILKTLRDKEHIRVILLGHSLNTTFEIICAAYRLNMTVENDFIIIISPWIYEGLYEDHTLHGTSVCSKEEMKTAILGTAQIKFRRAQFRRTLTFSLNNEKCLARIFPNSGVENDVSKTVPDKSGFVSQNVSDNTRTGNVTRNHSSRGQDLTDLTDISLDPCLDPDYDSEPRETKENVRKHLAVKSEDHLGYHHYTIKALEMFSDVLSFMLTNRKSSVSYPDSIDFKNSVGKELTNRIEAMHNSETKFDKNKHLSDNLTVTWSFHQINLDSSSKCRKSLPANSTTQLNAPNFYPHINDSVDSKPYQSVLIFTYLVTWVQLNNSLTMWKCHPSGSMTKLISDCRRCGIKEAVCRFSPLDKFFKTSCDTVKYSIIGCCTFLGFILLILILWISYRCNSTEQDDPDKRAFEFLCSELEDINISPTMIVLNRRVGQGAFGLVYGGEAKLKNWESVAVKVINNSTSFLSKRDFLNEAKLMRDLKHENVVRLVGICLHPNNEYSIYLVMEFMLNGDLKSYLLSRRVQAQTEPEHSDINSHRLTQFALNIASGVNYLHNLSLIHRDIASRNCLVNQDLTVKIGDFGLTRRSRNNQPDGYYRFTRSCELPVRWMSPESVQFGVFNILSDVWSYGIVLFEIVTFGVFPYEGMVDMELVEKVKRRELCISEFLPPAARETAVWKLIQECCQYTPENRPPSMDIVCQKLRENDTAIRAFLTEEPPKPNTILSELPFQPGAGACNMTDIMPTTPAPHTPGALQSDWEVHNATNNSKFKFPASKSSGRNTPSSLLYQVEHQQVVPHTSSCKPGNCTCKSTAPPQKPERLSFDFFIKPQLSLSSEFVNDIEKDAILCTTPTTPEYVEVLPETDFPTHRKPNSHADKRVQKKKRSASGGYSNLIWQTGVTPNGHHTSRVSDELSLTRFAGNEESKLISNHSSYSCCSTDNNTLL